MEGAARILLFKKVRFFKILSLFVSLCGALFHRETTLRTPRELPETATTEKVLFIKIGDLTENFVVVVDAICLPSQYLCQFPLHPFVKFLYTFSICQKSQPEQYQPINIFGTPFE